MSRGQKNHKEEPMTNHKKRRDPFPLFVSLSLIVFILVGCGGPSAAELAAIDYAPVSRGEWPVSTPQEQGLDPQLIAKLYANASQLETIYSLLVFKNGYLIAEDYFHIGAPDLKVNIHSVTKSINSALVGIALEQGCLTGLDQKMMDFFPELTDRITDARKKEITIRQMLQMRAGYPWEEATAEGTDFLFSGFRPSNLVDVPLVYDPGSDFGLQQLYRPPSRGDCGACLQYRPQVFCPGTPVQPAGHRAGFLANRLGRQLPGVFRYPPFLNGPGEIWLAVPQRG